jgi:hypothetical protein
MDYSNYYLDLAKVGELKTQGDKDRINSYYSDMLHSSNDKRDQVAKSLFHTLFKNGYLKEIRDEKIEQILS